MSTTPATPGATRTEAPRTPVQGKVNWKQVYGVFLMSKKVSVEETVILPSTGKSRAGKSKVFLLYTLGGPSDSTVSLPLALAAMDCFVAS